MIAFWEDPNKLSSPIQQLVVALERVLGVQNGVPQVAAGYAPVSGAEVASRVEDRFEVIAQQLSGLGLSEGEAQAVAEVIRGIRD